MKYFEILLFLLISGYSTTQDTPNPQQQVVINDKNVTLDTNGTSISVDPQPPNSNISTTTTVPPKSTTATTTHLPTTSTTKAPTTKPSTTPVPTTPVTKPTTTNVPTSTTTNATTVSPVTTAKPVDPSTPIPDHHRRFDGPSFVGGIVLALGLVAIGFVAFKFYKARTELNYHTL